jgi:hypothetical protein
MAAGICTEDPGGWRGSEIWRGGFGREQSIALVSFEFTFRFGGELPGPGATEGGRMQFFFFLCFPFWAWARAGVWLWRGGKLRISSTDLLPRAREPEGSTCQCHMPLLLLPTFLK